MATPYLDHVYIPGHLQYMPAQAHLHSTQALVHALDDILKILVRFLALNSAKPRFITLAITHLCTR